MSAHGSRSVSRLSAADLREQLAQEAARLMMESGIEDFGLAKRKAADRLGVRGAGALPSNAQIQQCLAERQRIFEPAAHEDRRSALRRAAAEIMAELAPFRPRLVGAVLAGTPTINSTIELHVFADEPEAVRALLEQRGTAVRDTQRRFRFGGQKTAQVPGFAFAYGAEVVEVSVFAHNGEREAPLSPVDQRPMRRAGRADVLALLAG
jgi:hypothetical protein